MSLITDSYKQAELALAAYADLFSATPNIANLQKAGMSAAQATDFLTHWEIVSQQSNTSSGFSATVFKRKDADPSGTYQMGQYVFAVRGSETFSVLPPEVDWFSADFGEIGGLGIALHQPSSVGSYIQAGRHLQRALLRLKAHKLNFAGFFNASGCGLMLAYGAHAIIFN